MSAEATKVCGDCGAPAVPAWWPALNHFPDCPTLLEQQAGVETTTTYSNQSPRRCPRCGSAMTRNHDQQSGTTTDICTGGACGATLTVLPRDPQASGYLTPFRKGDTIP